MIILEDMGFTRIRDVSDKSVSFDITARGSFQDEKDEKKTVDEIFSKCGGKVHQIQITRKNPRT